MATNKRLPGATSFVRQGGHLKSGYTGLIEGLVSARTPSRMSSDDFRRNVGLRSTRGVAKSARRYGPERGDT